MPMIVCPRCRTEGFESSVTQGHPYTDLVYRYRLDDDGGEVPLEPHVYVRCECDRGHKWEQQISPTPGG